MPDLIRHPEGIENTGFPIKDFGNDRQKNGVYAQALNKMCLFRHAGLDPASRRH